MPGLLSEINIKHLMLFMHSITHRWNGQLKLPKLTIKPVFFRTAINISAV